MKRRAGIAASGIRRVWEEGAPQTLAAGLSALGLGYRGLLGFRDALYAAGLLRSRALPCPVIGIGNLTLGGTGKTPAVELAVRTLREAGAEPGVVSRGYGRLTAGVQVVSDRTGIRLDARRAGDEPLLLARRLPGVPVVVGGNRFEAGKLCVERFGVSALVLDDAFQHRTLRKDLEVLLVNGLSPWGNGRLFPRGPLREPFEAMGRAHLLVVTRPPDADCVSEISRMFRLHNPEGALVLADYEPVECWQAQCNTSHAPDELKGRRLLAFAGIAYPEGFRETLARIGVTVAGFEKFPDHYWYEEDDLVSLVERARAGGAEGLVTTEKDWVRLSCLTLPPTPLWVLGIRMTVTDGLDRWRSAVGGVAAR